MDIRFDGKRALVTGAGKGIGKAIALKLAECGADVIAVSRTQSDLDELEKCNLKIKGLQLDVSDWERTKAVISDVGPIDLLVNNAGVGKTKEFGNVVEEEIDGTFNINVKAVINITQVVAEGMKKRKKGGSIVNLSSIGAFQTMHSLSVYSSSKAAVDHLTRLMAMELGPYGIRVNSVNPTVIRTQMAADFFDPTKDEAKKVADFLVERTPLKRLGEVDDVVYPVLFLLSDYASMVNGIRMPIDGGLTNSM